MLLMRISLPRRPGALGTVATALGSLDADINLVEIVEKGPDFEIDEFILDLPVGTADRSDRRGLRRARRGRGPMDPQLPTRWRNRIRSRTAPADERGHLQSGRNARVRLSDRVSRAVGLVLDVSAGPRVTFGTPAAPDLDAEILSASGRSTPPTGSPSTKDGCRVGTTTTRWSHRCPPSARSSSGVAGNRPSSPPSSRVWTTWSVRPAGRSTQLRSALRSTRPLSIGNH